MPGAYRLHERVVVLRRRAAWDGAAAASQSLLTYPLPMRPPDVCCHAVAAATAHSVGNGSVSRMARTTVDHSSGFGRVPILRWHTNERDPETARTRRASVGVTQAISPRSPELAFARQYANSPIISGVLRRSRHYPGRNNRNATIFSGRAAVSKPVRVGRRQISDGAIAVFAGTGADCLGDDVRLSGKPQFAFNNRCNDAPELIIDDGTFIGHHCNISVARSVRIGRHCLLAGG